MSKKTAVVTGASGGIGLELARLLAADGYDLIVTARRGERLQQLADELRHAHGVAVHVIPLDLAQPFAGEALWRAISAITPDIDVLVNNAGFADWSEFADEAPEIIERMIHLNVLTLTLLTRLVLPGMVERRRGNILNVSSLAGMQPGGPGMAVYYASKSYVLSFSRSIRRELRGSGVSVTVLCPGATRTGFEEAAHAQKSRMFHWMKPMEVLDVARSGYRGMQRGSAVVVPGNLNKLLAMVWLIPDALGIELNRVLWSERS
jgi:uncharacterized protein